MTDSRHRLARPVEQLEADGLIEAAGDGFRTTRQWQAAMSRAAFRLLRSGDTSDDLRVPITVAMLDRYGANVDDHRLAELVEAMLPIEHEALLGARR